MYSLYKQATVGNVRSPRPGIWDMLGRAKWDAWAKHKDLDPYEAKWLYVDALLKALKKQADKSAAQELIQELESYGGDPSNLVLSHSMTRSRGSDSSGSSDGEPARSPHAFISPQGRDPDMQITDEDSSGDESEDEARELPSVRESGQLMRPLSSMSSRYRTPLSGSFAPSSPPPARRSSVPPMQPLPGFEAPSAFADYPLSASAASATYPSSQMDNYPSPQHNIALPQMHSALPHSRHSLPYPQRQSMTSMTPVPGKPPSRLTLEQAVENVQAHLAALTERIDALESTNAAARRSTVSLPTRGSSGRASPNDEEGWPDWDINDLGLWSYIVRPMARISGTLKQLLVFFAHSGNRSPLLIIIRRLCLDITFTLAILGVLRLIWKKSNVRRREVNAALVQLWGAMIGSKNVRPRIQRA